MAPLIIAERGDTEPQRGRVVGRPYTLLDNETPLLSLWTTTRVAPTRCGAMKHCRIADVQ
jgi:hypothetical protein